MCRLLESIRCEDGRLIDAELHCARMVRSRSALWGCTADPDLRGALAGIAGRMGEGLWKVRVIYDTEIRQVEAVPYTAAKWCSAGLIDAPGLEYSHKFERRTELECLEERARAAGADAALIVRGGEVTDFSYANAAFFDGAAWFTPEPPLLEGTRRKRLLAAGRITPLRIRIDDIRRFTLVSPINAMLDLGEITVPVTRIFRVDQPSAGVSGQSAAVDAEETAAAVVFG